MKTNIYRCVEPCDSCPFVDRKTLHISEARLNQIKADLDKGGSFNCHKTAYPETFGVADIGLRMCWGAWYYLAKQGKKNQVMQVAERLGVE